MGKNRSRSGNGIEYHKCPEVSVPEKNYDRQRRDPISDSSSSGRSQVQQKKEAYKKARKTFDGYFDSVKELGKSALTGLAAKRHKSDILVELGGKAMAEQKMPFKMKMGIIQGRKNRERKKVNEIKESGEILAKSFGRKSSETGTDDGPGRGRSSGRGSSQNEDKSGGPVGGPRMKRGVFHLNKERIPGHLKSGK
jgi:hypothetical protein